MYEYDDLYAETLDWVNRVRSACGATPLSGLPKGVPGNKAECPIARSFKDIAEVRFGGEYLATTSDRLVDALLATTPSFDSGEYETDGAHWNGPTTDASVPERYSVVEFMTPGDDDDEDLPPTLFAAEFDRGEFVLLRDES